MWMSVLTKEIIHNDAQEDFWMTKSKNIQGFLLFWHGSNDPLLHGFMPFKE